MSLARPDKMDVFFSVPQKMHKTGVPKKKKNGWPSKALTQASAGDKEASSEETAGKRPRIRNISPRKMGGSS